MRYPRDTFRRHAVDTTQVAAVGNGNPEIIYMTTKRIKKLHLLPSLPRQVLAIFLSNEMNTGSFERGVDFSTILQIQLFC